MTLGERVQQQRKAKGWTRKELGQRAGLNPVHLAKVEAGDKRDPACSTLAKLARALGCTADYLLGLVDDDADEEAA